jgi:hypothetical protein
MPDLSGYEAWLTREGYQPTTIEATLRHLKNVAAKPKEIADHQEAHIQRYLRYVGKTRRHPLGQSLTKKLKAAGYAAAGDVRKPGSRSKKLLDAQQWSALRARLRERGYSDDTGKLLVAYMESPYRITEFLQLRPTLISADDVTDKISRDWLRNHRARRVFQVLCPTERCTYYRLRKRLRDVSEALGIPVDLDTLYKSYYELN